MTDLGTLGGNFSEAIRINDRGQVVGYSMTASGMLHAFLWEDGQMTSLTAQSGELYSVASDINNRGQMVGTLATKPLLILRCCNIVARWDWQAVLWGKGSRGPSSTFTSSDRSQSSKGQDTAPPFGIRATFEDSKQQELLLQALYPGPSGLEAPVVRLSTSER
jgi:probable HAF family extracellular repeat protein